MNIDQSQANKRFFLLILVLTGSFLLGSVFGQGLMFLALAAILQLFVQTYKSNLLLGWLNQKKKDQIPEAEGTWGVIYDELYSLQKRNQKQKKKLADAVNRFQKVINALPFATVVLNPDDEIEDMNGMAGTLLNLQFPRDRGQNITLLLRHPQFLHYFQGDHRKSLNIPAPHNDHINLGIQIIPFSDNKKLLIAEDKSYLNMLERMRTDFVANVSHELKTPITAISAYLEHLETQLENPKNIDVVNKMQGQTRRMNNIVSDLLTLSKIESSPFNAVQRVRIDIDSLVTEVIASLEPLARDKEITLQCELNSNGQITGNASQLKSVFSNLIGNAIHYSGHQTTIQIRSGIADDRLFVSVKDQGIGIEARHIPRITERFYRADAARSRETGGTGLGLAITKHALLQHQAELQIESTPGVGSTFSCFFPLNLSL